MVVKKFSRIFGNQFRGHNDYLQRKLNVMRTKIILGQRRGVREDFGDAYQAIDEYRQVVNRKVLECVGSGLF